MKDPEQSIGLLFHMFGIIMIARGFLGAFIVEQRFWKQVNSDISKSGAILPIMKTLPLIIQVGLLIQVISGVVLLHARNWQYWGENWLSIKLIFVALAFANGILVGKRLGGKIGAQVFSPSPDKAALVVLKGKMKTCNFIQTVLILGILTLATVFR